VTFHQRILDTLSLECSLKFTANANGESTPARHHPNRWLPLPARSCPTPADSQEIPSTRRCTPKREANVDQRPSKRQTTIVIGVFSAMINRIPAWTRESNGYVPMGTGEGYGERGGEAGASVLRCVFRDEGSALNPGRTSLSCYRARISRGSPSIPAPAVPASGGCRC